RSSAPRPAGYRARPLCPGRRAGGGGRVRGFAARAADGTLVPIPAMVLALLVGIALNPLATKPLSQPGIAFCGKTLLRWAVACLGIRIALADIASLGVAAAVLVVAAMAATLLSGFALARMFGQTVGFGALAGAGTAVCG